VTALALDPSAPLSAPSDAFRAYAAMGDDELERIFREHDGPEPEALSQWEWRGFNTPWWTRLLGIQKFIKAFDATPRGVEGWNIRVTQRGMDVPWAHKPSPEDPRAFGFFDVRRVDTKSRDHRYPRATLLDYGSSPRNRLTAIDDLTMKVLRDYVVQPDACDPNVMLGKAYIALGPFRLYSNFFVIERSRPIVRRLSSGS
jgi:hypothetical protein